MRAILRIQNGGFEGMTYELGTEPTVIGRNPNTDITLLDEGISREHAIIEWNAAESHYAIEDLPSTNGTKVNGKRVRSCALSDGDEIVVGQTAFTFTLAPAD